MIIDICRGCDRDVFEPNVQLAQYLIGARIRQGFRVVHCWWTGVMWWDCVKEAAK